ncbi:MAG: 3'(2'),5'-bisphosphate nucleotidase CysQ [Pseudomonadota bacterium]|nr:3'(2'),5'-bisphosphate nucleotidase CysQ [Pseudomonadota bacterium]
MPTTIPSPDSELLPAVRAIARAAGQQILEVYGTDFQSQAKADDSPLTEADLRAHHLIAAELARLTPTLPLLSEESAEAVTWEERRHWHSYWLVDPLDGTKEFIARNGEFTVNIALIRDHRPVLGVVHIPVSDTTYSGIPGIGAWRENGERPPLPIAARRVAIPPFQVLGSRSHESPKLAAALAGLGPHELRAAGSSIKLCLVADGAADLYPRLGGSSEWDIAAGQAIVEAAGGQVVSLVDGLALRYNKPELLNPKFLAYGDPQFWRRWPR